MPDREQTRLDAQQERRSLEGADATRRDGMRTQDMALFWLVKANALLAELDQAERERDEALAKVSAASTMLAEAEKIVPGTITTAGRFSIGLNDRERAEAAEVRLAKVPALVEALREILRQLDLNDMSRSDIMGTDPEVSLNIVADVARKALAALEESSVTS